MFLDLTRQGLLGSGDSVLQETKGFIMRYANMDRILDEDWKADFVKPYNDFRLFYPEKFSFEVFLDWKENRPIKLI